MRSKFCSEILKQCTNDPRFVFITGDLGYKNLEPIQSAMGNRFINAGISEQNMISVAAALAKEGLRPFVYSIAPFCFARPFEQIRNDVCLHNLPVVIIGNGGGFGYGVMGPTHHAIEDYGIMLSLQNMKVLVPAFSTDIEEVINEAINTTHPTYIRLGLDEKPASYSPSEYTQWRIVKNGEQNIIISIGSITGKLMHESYEKFTGIPHKIWSLSKFPLLENNFPDELIYDLKNAQNVIIVEEHIQQGSASSMIALHLMQAGIAVRKYISLNVKGYLSGFYGNQQFHRDENNLNLESAFKCLNLL